MIITLILCKCANFIIKNVYSQADKEIQVDGTASNSSAKLHRKYPILFYNILRIMRFILCLRQHKDWFANKGEQN